MMLDLACRIGHCLVLSRRVVSRFSDLTREEVVDLWTTAHTIAPVLEKQFNGKSLTLAIQDGAQAGQTVPHVHVHIIPRIRGDFERNDEVYEALDKEGAGKRFDDEDRKARTPEEMKAEADVLRPLFQSTSLTIPEDEA